MSLTAGDRLGPYQILSGIGTGGMGEVWKARDTRLDRTVAIKTIHGAFSQRFEREAKAISSLNHPHICTLYDVGEHDGRGYLVMELVEGEPLAGPLPLERVLTYGAQICSALEAAHKRGIVHRDLKPANILVTKAGVKLLDFGLAKTVGGREGRAGEAGRAGEETADAQITKMLTGEHVILGTPQYMAPEQIEGKEADGRTDLFALGCVLYELLTGAKPFEGKSPSSVMAAILATEPRPLKDLQPLTPPALERAIKRCLAKDPDDRWQSARDLRAEFDWIASGAGGPASSLSQVPAKRSILPWTVAAALAIGVALALWAPWRTASLPERAVRFEIYPPEHESFNGRPMISPDGKKIAMRTRDAGGRTYLLVRRLDTLETLKLADTDAANVPAWSPDSRYLAFVADRKVKKIDASGGSALPVADFQLGYIPYISWGKGDVILFSGSGIKRVSAAGGVPAQVTVIDDAHPDGPHSPQVLADGQHLLNFVQGRPEVSGLYAGSFDKPPDLVTGTLVTKSRSVYAHVSNAGDFILFERDGALLGQRFDVASLRLTGEPFSVAPQIGITGRVLPSVSVSDDGVMVYSADPDPGRIRQLTWFDRTGKPLADVGAPAPHQDLALSPDQRRIAVTESGDNTDIWTLDLESGSTLSRFTLDPQPDVRPVWSADSRSLLYARDTVLYEKAIDRNSTERVVLESRETAAAVGPLGRGATDWRADGRILVENQGDLFVLSGGQLTQLTRTPAREIQSQFSPDGKWIAYTSNETRRNEIWVRPFPSGEPRQVTTTGGSQPRWNPSGSELFYVALDNRLTVIPVKVGSGFEPGTPQTLFLTTIADSNNANPSTGYVVSKEGQRFLVNGVADLPRPFPVTVVTNWIPDGK